MLDKCTVNYHLDPKPAKRRYEIALNEHFEAWLLSRPARLEVRQTKGVSVYRHHYCKAGVGRSTRAKWLVTTDNSTVRFNSETCSRKNVVFDAGLLYDEGHLMGTSRRMHHSLLSNFLLHYVWQHIKTKG